MTTGLAVKLSYRTRLIRVSRLERQKNNTVAVLEWCCFLMDFVLSGFNTVDDGAKGFGVVNGEFGKNFAIKRNAFGFEAVDKLTV